MSNTILNPTIIAKTAVRLLENELSMGSSIYRGYEEEFAKNYNGYKVGASISIRKPAQFTVRSGTTMAVQDVVEGTTTISVDTVKGVDFEFTSTDLTLKIDQLAERVIRPAMIRLANEIDYDLLSLFKDVPLWVGTPGSAMNGFASISRITQRMTQGAVPEDDRHAILSPSDYWGLVNNLTGLYIGQAGSAYASGKMPKIAGLSLVDSPNVNSLTTGTRTNGTVNGAGQQVTYSGAQANSYTQTLNVTGLGAAGTVKAGEVFTIANVFAINPVTKRRVDGSPLQQFVVTADATADGAGAAALTISMPIITSGAFQTVELASGTALPSGGTVTWVGSASTAYAQNLAFHRNAFAMVAVPMERPPGAVDVARESYKGLNVRVIPVYDGINDKSAWRLDVLYGKKTIDPRLAVRASQ